MTTKYEIICIDRCGFNFLHSERVELAAKVYYHGYTKTKWYNAIMGETPSQCELFVPRLVNGIAPDWNTL